MFDRQKLGVWAGSPVDMSEHVYRLVWTVRKFEVETAGLPLERQLGRGLFIDLVVDGLKVGRFVVTWSVEEQRGVIRYEEAR